MKMIRDVSDDVCDHQTVSLVSVVGPRIQVCSEFPVLLEQEDERLLDDERFITHDGASLRASRTAKARRAASRFARRQSDNSG